MLILGTIARVKTSEREKDSKNIVLCACETDGDSENC